MRFPFLFGMCSFRLLDPGAGEGGGGGAGAGNGGAGAGKGAGAGEGGDKTPAAFDRAEFDTYRENTDRTIAELREANRTQKEFIDRIGGALGGDKDKKQPAREPKRSDFPPGEAGALQFIDARADYRYDLKHGKNEADRTASENEQAEARAAELSVRQAGIAHNQRIAEAAEEIPDFAAVVSKVKFPFGDDLSLDIMKRKNSAHIVHHLAKTPADLQKLWMLEQTDPSEAHDFLVLLDHQFTESRKAAKLTASKNRYPVTSKTGGKTDKASAKDLVRSVMWD